MFRKMELINFNNLAENSATVHYIEIHFLKKHNTMSEQNNGDAELNTNFYSNE